MIATNTAKRGLRWNGMAALSGFVLQLLQLVLCARLLSPTAFGVFAMALIVFNLSQLFGDMGWGNRLVSLPSFSQKDFSSFYWSGLLLGIGLFILCFFLAPWISQLAGKELTAILRLASFGFLLYPLHLPFQYLAQRELRFRLMAGAEFTASLLAFLVAVPLAFALKSAEALAYGILASLMAKVALYLFTYHNALRNLSSWKPSMMISGWGFAGFQLTERLIQFFRGQLDKVMLAAWMGFSALGFYSVLTQMITRPILLANPVLSKIGYPILSQAQSDPERLKRLYLEMIRMVSLYTYPLFFALAFTAPLFIPTLLGSQWKNAIAPFQWLCLWGIVVALGNILPNLLLAKGKAGLSLAISLFSMIISLGALWFGSRRGLEGACAALAGASLFLLYPLNLWMTSRVAGIPIRIQLLVAGVFGGLAALGLLPVWWSHGLLKNLPDSLELSFKIILMGLFYLVVLRIFQKNYFFKVLNGILGRDNPLS